MTWVRMIENSFSSCSHSYSMFDVIVHCSNIVSEEMIGTWSSDFFERVKIAMNVKVSLMSKYPSILLFLSSMFSEKEKSVENEVKEFIVKNMAISNQTALEGVDLFKFKADIDIKLVYKILVHLTEGYLSKIPVNKNTDIKVMIRELDECIHLLKNNFYKESYL